MRRLFNAIDRSLRGQYTSREALREGRIQVSAKTLLVASILLGLIYGAFMGLYAPLRPENPSLEQMFATTIKVPLLFLLTLAVTFPSLYVFSALSGSRLRFLETLRFLLIGVLVNLALVASFGPVTGFFTLSTESYPFILVLNVVFFTVGGIAGLVFIFKGLQAAVTVEEQPWEVVKDEPVEPDEASKPAEDQPTPAGGSQSSSAAPSPTTSPSPSRPLLSTQPTVRARGAKGSGTSDGGALTIFYVWSVIFGAVGAQMGWILRPFVGSPRLEFEWFRERESHFFEAIGRTLSNLFS